MKTYPAYFTRRSFRISQMQCRRHAPLRGLVRWRLLTKRPFRNIALRWAGATVLLMTFSVSATMVEVDSLVVGEDVDIFVSGYPLNACDHSYDGIVIEADKVDIRYVYDPGPCGLPFPRQDRITSLNVPVGFEFLPEISVQVSLRDSLDDEEYEVIASTVYFGPSVSTKPKQIALTQHLREGSQLVDIHDIESKSLIDSRTFGCRGRDHRSMTPFVADRINKKLITYLNCLYDVKILLFDIASEKFLSWRFDDYISDVFVNDLGEIHILTAFDMLLSGNTEFRKITHEVPTPEFSRHIAGSRAGDSLVLVTRTGVLYSYVEGEFQPIAQVQGTVQELLLDPNQLKAIVITLDPPGRVFVNLVDLVTHEVEQLSSTQSNEDEFGGAAITSDSNLYVGHVSYSSITGRPFWDNLVFQLGEPPQPTIDGYVGDAPALSWNRSGIVGISRSSRVLLNGEEKSILGGVQEVRGEFLTSLLNGAPGISAAFAGLWLNPNYPGQGLIIQVVANNQLIVTWNGFDGDGNPYWTWASGFVEGETFTGTAYVNEGGVFPGGQLLEDDAVEQRLWGTFQIDFEGCDRARFQWSSAVPEFGEGQMMMWHATTPHLVDCQ